MEVIMKWSFDFDETTRIVYVKTSGELNIKETEKIRKESYLIKEKYNANKFLLDHTEIKSGGLKIWDLYNLPQKYSAEGYPRNSQLAVLVNESYKETFDFYETVSVNNGYKIKVFTNKNEAINWLYL